MKFEEILPALREGKKVKKRGWKGDFIFKSPFREEIVFDDWKGCNLSWEDFLADDWEIIKEPKKVKLRDLTAEQYKEWFKNNCPKYDDDCCGCPFQKVKCVNREKKNDSRYLNKDLYSDKFLDQEIEIED